ncbi:MAG TPA: hypothetical protein VF719_04500, partial [Abditibacteriaceae bacterium]
MKPRNSAVLLVCALAFCASVCLAQPPAQSLEPPAPMTANEVAAIDSPLFFRAELSNAVARRAGVQEIYDREFDVSTADAAAVVQAFVGMLHLQLYSAAHAVSGAKTKETAIGDIMQEIAKTDDVWTVSDLKIVKQNGAEAEVEAHIQMRNRLGFESSHIETVPMIRNKTSLGEMWQIVPF